MMLLRHLRRPLTTTPIQPTRYVQSPGIPGILDFWNSSDCTSRADLATSPLSCALTLKSTGLLAHARAQRLPLVQLCVNLLLGHGGRAVEFGRRQPRHCPDAVLVPLLALEVAQNEVRLCSTLAIISSSKMSPVSCAMLSCLSSLQRLGDRNTLHPPRIWPPGCTQARRWE